MFKAMAFLFRRSDLDAEEFQRYSREVHVPLADQANYLDVGRTHALVVAEQSVL
jgi:hypothetical protein